MTPEPVETRLPPERAASSAPSSAAVPSPSVVTISPAPVSTGAPSGPPRMHRVTPCPAVMAVRNRCRGPSRPSESSGPVPNSRSRAPPSRSTPRRHPIRTLRISGDRARVDAAAIDALSSRATTARPFRGCHRKRRRERRPLDGRRGRRGVFRDRPRAGQRRSSLGRRRDAGPSRAAQPDRLSPLSSTAEARPVARPQQPQRVDVRAP